MKKIIMNNKLPLFLMACVLMLSAFYAFAPNNKSDNSKVVNGNLEESNSYVYFDEEKINILEERNVAILTIEQEIATGDFNIDSVTNKMTEIDEIYKVSLLESELEKEIEALGYTDVLVHNYVKTTKVSDTLSLSEDVIDVKVLTESITKEKCIVITQLAKTKFGSNDFKVEVIIENGL